ncbi:MAG: hypothetical protein IT191_02125 [Microbacteriaceae bacterium]|nr:hypothetical protein [Microbacteriaceae bacterium]
MPNLLWPSGSITVVLLPSGDQGDELLNLAREWTGYGLLSPTMWVKPSGVTGEGGKPPEVTATLIAQSRDGGLIEDEVQVFEVLAVEKLRKVRLVKIRSALPDQVADINQDGIAETLSRYVSLSIPLGSPGQSGNSDRIQLLRITLVCSPTDLKTSERLNSELKDSAILVYASPEDRATPDAGDAFVRDNSRFHGFVLMHAATVGGIWTGLPIGTFEAFEHESSLSKAIWIPRVFVSAVRTGGLSRRVSASVVQDATDGFLEIGGVPVVAEETSLILQKDFPHYVQLMLQNAVELDGGSLKFRSVPNQAIPDPIKLTIFGQLKHFLLFSANKIRRIPYWSRIWAHDKAARKSNKALQGDDGKFKIETLGDREVDPIDGLLLESAHNFTLVKSEDKSTSHDFLVFNEETGRAEFRSVTPRLWAGLRRLMFSALDAGGEANDRLPPIEGRTPVFGDPSGVVPDNRSTWTYPGGNLFEPGRTFNWLTARTNPPLREVFKADVDDIAKDIPELKSKLSSEQEMLNSAEAILDETIREFIASGLLKYSKDGRVLKGRRKKSSETEVTSSKKTDPKESQAPEPSPEDAIEKYRELKQIVTSYKNACEITSDQISELESRLSIARVILDSFEEWYSRQSRSFGWQLLDFSDSQLNNAHRELEKVSNQKIELPDRGELVRLRRRFHRSLGIVGTIVAILTALALALPPIATSAARSMATDELSSDIFSRIVKFALSKAYPEWWQILLVAGALFILISLGILAAYYRDWSRLEQKLTVARARSASAVEQIANVRREVERVSGIRSELIDWLQMLSTVIHEPWSVPPGVVDGEANTPNADRFPFALHIATAVGESGKNSTRLRETVATGLVKAGWRTSAFELLLSEIRSTLGFSESQLGTEALDNDLTEASNGARARLRGNLGDRAILESVALRQIRGLNEKASEREIYEADIVVKPMWADPLMAFRGGEGEDTELWKEFLTQSLGDSSDEPIPLSPLGIARHEIQKSYHEKVETYILAPKRIATEIGSEKRSGTHVISNESEIASNLDVVVRIDLAGPVPPEAIRFLNAEDGMLNPYDANADIPVCPNCGKSTCPAADPNSEEPCEESGI